MEQFKYEQSDIHLSYDRARALPDETVNLWLNAISERVYRQDINTIVDMGCGTGRFSEALSTHFSAGVIGIEPSLNMLLTAKQAGSSLPVEYIRGTAENIPIVSDKADMVFLSMVYHHIRDKTGAANEFNRILKKGGFLCIRTSTPEQFDTYLWMKFFPGARDIDRERLPSKDSLVATLESAGFRLQEHSVIRQLFALNLSEYMDKIRLRGISSLKQIPDIEFQEGLIRLEEYCLENETGKPVLEDISLFLFRVANE